MDVMLIGNPNCGKTTVFNGLTGEHQRVGNWPGVTVEKKTGLFSYASKTIRVTDLPGVYSLVVSEGGNSQDEQITARAVAQDEADLFINVVDACHLERHLYLTSQLMELGKPVIIALNMMDVAAQRGIIINQDALAKQLKCPVVALEAHRGMGLDALKQVLAGPRQQPGHFPLVLPSPLSALLNGLEQQLSKYFKTRSLIPYIARRVLEGDSLLMGKDASTLLEASAQSEERAIEGAKRIEDWQDLDIVLADARYQAVHQVVKHVQTKRSDASEHLTAKIDRIVLHRFFALPIFLGVMYCMFLFAINIGGAFQDFFDITTDAVFVQGTAWLLQQVHGPHWLIALSANGVGKGIHTILTFIPVIAAMFFFLSLLELSGYMARAAFVVDKMMRMLGLPGKSFVPMIVGFGCNVPAIMAARTLDSERDRLLTILMSPFMSCSARLAIYAVFVAAFFPTGGQNVVFSLYLIGIFMAVLTGYLLRKTLFQGQASPLIIELPAYHKPSWSRLLKEVTLRLRHFIWRAGKLILPVCVILGGLNAMTLHGGVNMLEASQDSLLSHIGRWLTPVFSPMGVSQENWPATVGLLTGMLAKEVVIGSLNTLYANVGELTHTVSSGFHFWDALQTALMSIPHHLAQLGTALLNPIAASAPMSESSQSVYGVMHRYFDGKSGAYAYLLFILLYIPCVSTMAAIRQEANRQLMWFSVAWSFSVAYVVAVSFYQLATVMAHPKQTILWLTVFFVLIFFAMIWIRVSRRNTGGRHAFAGT